jgi:hypothetical protein
VEEEHRHSDRDLADGPASSNHCVQQLLSKAEKRRVDGGSGVLISEKRWDGEKEMWGEEGGEWNVDGRRRGVLKTAEADAWGGSTLIKEDAEERENSSQ